MAVSFSPDGRVVATGCGDGTAQLWSTDTWRPIRAPIKHGNSTSAVTFSPNGQTLAITNRGSVRLWDRRTGLPLGAAFSFPGVSAVSFSPNGRMIAVAADERVRMWDVPPPVPDEPKRVWLSVELRTSRTIEDGVVRPLTDEELTARRLKLEKLDGDCLVRRWQDLSEQEKQELTTPLLD